MKKRLLAISLASIVTVTQLLAQGDPKVTEVWSPIPKMVTTDKVKSVPPPMDAIVLFDGNNLDKWVSTNDVAKPANWIVKRNIFTVNKEAGNIQTKQSFTDYQLHLEWRIPKNITGEGQARGNSGLFLASTGPGDDGYEIQILDSYNNQTYVNGQTGSIYKQAIPLANACKKPGEWQSYDIVWKAPRFNNDGSIQTPAYVTVIQNGVVVQNNTELKGATTYIGKPSYKKHGASPIKLQAHGDKSEPISFRNLWIREL